MKLSRLLLSASARSTAALVVYVVAAGAVGAQTDDFNDGNDAGWSRYSPLGFVGAGATYTYPGGAYRVTAPASPDPAVVGPQRAGSVRPEKTYTRLQVATDVTGWDDTINQSFGIIARVGTLGLGTTRAYTYNYNTRSGYHQITLVQNEGAAGQVDESPFRVDPAQHYRMVFTMVGANLLGQMFSATNSAVPIHSVLGADTNYASGTAGLFAFALDPSGPVDARFDNYAAAVPGKVRATMLDAVPAVGERPDQPIDTVKVRVASIETTFDPASIRLEIDGKAADFDMLDGNGYLLLVHSPGSPLDPAAPHTATLVFRDEDGEQTFSWSFGAAATAAVPVLLSAGGLGENFLPVAGAVSDTGALTVRVPVQDSRRFFRVSDAKLRKVVSTSRVGGDVLITFE